MFIKKDKNTKSASALQQSLQHKASTTPKSEKEGSSPLLERYLQKTLTDHMQGANDEALAKAIQTMLYKDQEKNKHLN